MRNKAKCKLCDDIIESFHPTDYVSCKCDQIAVDGGDAMRCYAKDFANFARVDDEGNEIEVTIVDDTSKKPPKAASESDDMPKKAELVDMLKEMIKSYDNLPDHALLTPCTNLDMKNALLVIYGILR